MKTIIQSNGSKWAGSAPDSIDKLIEVLGEYALDPMFENYGNFTSVIDEVYKGGKNNGEPHVYNGLTSFHGNFYELSHVFNIYSDDPEIIEKLSTAILANKATPEYKTALLEFREGERQAKEAAAKKERERAAKPCTCGRCSN